jgi:hypothetical protein
MVQYNSQRIIIHLISIANKTQQPKCLPNIAVNFKDTNLSHSKMKTNNVSKREKFNEYTFSLCFGKNR